MLSQSLEASAPEAKQNAGATKGSAVPLVYSSSPFEWDQAPLHALGLLLDLLSIDGNLQILQDSAVLQWGWKSPEIATYVIPTLEVDYREQVGEALRPALYVAKLLNACLQSASGESYIPKEWVVKSLCVILGFAAKHRFYWTSDLIKRASTFLLTTAIAFQSLPDSSVEFLERVYETAYFLKSVTVVPATSASQTTEQDETIKVESGSTSADERKKRVILRLAHLVSCDKNAFVSGSVGLGGAEVMAMARSVSPKIVKGVLKASELLLSQMSPAEIQSSSRWFRQSGAMSEVKTLYANGLTAYSTDSKGKLDGTLLAGYIKRLLSKTEPALITVKMQSLILAVFDQSRFQNRYHFEKESIRQVREILSLCPERKAIISSLSKVARLIFTFGVENPISPQSLGSILKVHSIAVEESAMRALMQKTITETEYKETIETWHRVWGFILANGPLFMEENDESKHLDDWVTRNLVLLEQILEGTQG